METAAENPVVIQTPDTKVFRFPDQASAEQFERDVRQAGGGELVRLAPVPPPVARPLYDLEQHLAALIDTEEMVSAEQDEEYSAELQRVLIQAVEKRDRVGQFMAWLESQAALAQQEMQRLAERRAFFQRALARMEGYVTRVIESLGVDEKVKRKRLEGNTVTFALHGCEKRVEITDDQAVPAKYKRAAMTLPADLWEELMDSINFELRERVLAAITSPRLEVSSSLIKADLKADVAVPGAKLVGGTYLVRK